MPVLAGFSVPSLVTLPIPSITSVPLRWHGCALYALLRVAIVPIELVTDPPLKVPVDLFGGAYADDAFVLCGNWVRGGPLDFPEGTNALSRSRNAFQVVGPSVEFY